MKALRRTALLALGLTIAGCNSGGGNESAAPSGETVAANESSAKAVAPEPKLAACPFQNTSDWHASVESGHLLVNGKVDLLMAGFKPTLTRRAGGGDAFAFDLALKPETGAVVNDRARYEESGVAGKPLAEIWCGGDKIETIDVVQVAD